jgi:hypothetical protein
MGEDKLSTIKNNKNYRKTVDYRYSNYTKRVDLMSSPRARI